MSDKMQYPIKPLFAEHNALNVLRTTGIKPTSIVEFSSTPVEYYFSAETKKVMESIRGLENNTLSISEKLNAEGNTLDERLFDARASVKVLLSKVSMHFSDDLRQKILRQIDLLHAPDDWEEGDDPIQLQSFNTFLRWFYLNKPKILPSFGLSSTGYLISFWLSNNNKDRLILEFLSKDQIKWFVTKYYDEQAEHSTGTTSLSRIRDVLAPYSTDGWFAK